MPQQSAHRVHLRVARSCIAAAVVDLFEDDRRFRDAEPGAAVRLGNQRREIAGGRERLDERLGIRARCVELAPIRIGKRLAQIADRVSQVLVKFGNRHGVII